VNAQMASPADRGVLVRDQVLVDKVRALQHTLYRTAKADPGRRFHALWDKVLRRDVLWRAWVAVRANNGAPGVDRTTLDWIEKEYGIDRLLDELSSELREGSYRPLPARRLYSAKPGTIESDRCRFPRYGIVSCRPRSRSCSSRSLKRTSPRAVSGFARSGASTTPCRCSSMRPGAAGGGCRCRRLLFGDTA
jgi:hypothetical protein